MDAGSAVDGWLTRRRLPQDEQVRLAQRQSADFLDAVYGNFPLMILAISGLTFLLLARAFRSILLPLQAVVLNLLSVAAGSSPAQR
jgi:putative drug exporter of the RND superfamily